MEATLAEVLAPTLISKEYWPAWRLMWPVVTFRRWYRVGIVPLDGSATNAAGRICNHVPGVPAAVQTHSPPSASRQNSLRTQVPLVCGPMMVAGRAFDYVGSRLTTSVARVSQSSWQNSSSQEAWRVGEVRVHG